MRGSQRYDNVVSRFGIDIRLTWHVEMHSTSGDKEDLVVQYRASGLVARACGGMGWENEFGSADAIIWGARE